MLAYHRARCLCTGLVTLGSLLAGCGAVTPGGLTPGDDGGNNGGPSGGTGGPGGGGLPAGGSGGGDGGTLPSGVIDEGAEFGGHPQSPAAYRDALTPDEAYHLLRRAAFGATPQQVDKAVREGLTKTVDDLLVDRPVPASLTELAEIYQDDMPKRWLIHLIESPNPLRERLALFWHDRFATSRRVAFDGPNRFTSVLHWEMLRRNALGNYRQFLQELTIDPLMLVWLDGGKSPKENPNENYTREFWELFTLGRDVLYTEQDIREGARAFTGITIFYQSNELPRPIYDLLHHDETPKAIFPARAAPQNHSYLSVIDLTLQQPEAARYAVRNLFDMLMHDHPSDELLDDLAGGFVDGDFEIAPLVRRILRSSAMFSTDAVGNQIASPVEHYVGFARTLDMHAYSEQSQVNMIWAAEYDLSMAGQELLNPPGVEGWDEAQAWLQDQSLTARSSTLRRVMEFGPERTPLVPMHLLPPIARWTEREVRGEMVDAIAAAFHLHLSEAERDIYIEVLDQNGWRAFHLLAPEEQPRYLVEMIRLMAMHEGVITR